MSDSTESVAPATAANAADKPARKRTPNAGKTPTTVPTIARAMLRARGIKSDERIAEQCKVVRGRLRGAYWSALVKSAPKSYGPKGAIKREPNDRRPWGAIPADVARTMIKSAR